jgi:hypothetical protein
MQRSHQQLKKINGLDYHAIDYQQCHSNRNIKHVKNVAICSTAKRWGGVE